MILSFWHIVSSGCTRLSELWMSKSYGVYMYCWVALPKKNFFPNTTCPWTSSEDRTWFLTSRCVVAKSVKRVRSVQSLCLVSDSSTTHGHRRLLSSAFLNRASNLRCLYGWYIRRRWSSDDALLGSGRRRWDDRLVEKKLHNNAVFLPLAWLMIHSLHHLLYIDGWWTDTWACTTQNTCNLADKP